MCVWVCVCVRKSFLWKPVFNCVVILQFSKRAKYFSAVIFPIHFMKYRSSINSIFKWYHWNETQLLTIRTKIFQVIFTWMSKEFCCVCIIHTTQFKPWWQLDAIVGCWWADTLSIASLPMWFEDCTDELIREFMLNDFKKYLCETWSYSWSKYSSYQKNKEIFTWVARTSTIRQEQIVLSILIPKPCIVANLVWTWRVSGKVGIL